MKIGLYFGSFNPIHTGHLIIANFMAYHTDLDKVWLVVSPHNPLKESSSLLNEHHRLHLAEMAIQDEPRLRVSNIEFCVRRPAGANDTRHLRKGDLDLWHVGEHLDRARHVERRVGEGQRGRAR